MSKEHPEIVASSESHAVPLPHDKDFYPHVMAQLASVIRSLADAHDMNSITAIIREAARELTGADGATFVLRDGDQCYYLEENAIAPLWKGQRFPMCACVSGWAMAQGRTAVIEDIYKDPRVPEDAYRPTFVKSMVMVPINKSNPVGAIGNYWAKKRMPSEEEVVTLQILADITGVAMENAALRQKENTLQAKAS